MRKLSGTRLAAAVLVIGAAGAVRPVYSGRCHIWNQKTLIPRQSRILR
jgi:hypothetical protein